MKFNMEIYSYCLITVVIIFLYNMINTILSFNWNNEEIVYSNINNNIFILIWLVAISIIISFQSDKNYFIYKFKEKVSKKLYTEKTEDENIYKVLFGFYVKEDVDRILTRDVICYFNKSTWEIFKYDYRDWKNIHFDVEEKKILEEIIWSYIKIRYFRVKWLEKIVKIISKKYYSIFDKENEYKYKMEKYRLE